MTESKYSRRLRDKTIYIVPHVHWDREWYLPFEKFRYHLVDLVDGLLDLLEEDEEYAHFLLDGQSVVIEDYLELKPERKEELTDLVSNNRIGTGPWYTLPDEFIPSGESLIRNILLGQQVAEEFGGGQRIGYIPDSFGHVSQMPQIIKGFGLKGAVFTRGIGNEEVRSEFKWKSPSGDEVLAHYLTHSYAICPRLSQKPEDVKGGGEGPWNYDSFGELLARLEEKSIGGSLLLPVGADHVRPQNDLISAIKSLKEHFNIRHCSLEEYHDSIESELDDDIELDAIKDELRGALDWPVLPGTLSARTPIKQQNFQAFRNLADYAERIHALIWAFQGEGYPNELLTESWKDLLKNHAHDSICGCSVDSVYDDVTNRYKRIKERTNRLIKHGITSLASLDVSASGDEYAVSVFNPQPTGNSGVVTADLPRDILSKGDSKTYSLLDENGNRVKLTAGKETLTPKNVLNGVKHEKGRSFSFFAEEVPPCGYKTYKLVEREPEVKRGKLNLSGSVMENEFLSVEFSENGTFSLRDRRTDRVFEKMNYFEDQGDAGDEYNYCPPEEDKRITTLDRKPNIEFFEESAWITARVSYNFQIPESLTVREKSRSDQLVSQNIESSVTVYRGIDRVDVETKIENEASDHRIRAVFPTGLAGEEVIAETAFDVVERPRVPDSRPDWIESPSRTAPQEGFVALEDGNSGLALFNQGLPEYESGKDGYLALTLLRCVGQLFREELPVREGDYPLPYDTPGAQNKGIHRFRYSLMPYSGDWQSAEVVKSSRAFSSGLWAESYSGNFDSEPEKKSLLEVKPDDLVLSAIKKAENSGELVIRIFNPTAKPRQGEVRLNQNISSAYRSDLKEDSMEEIPVQSGSITITVGASEIVTIKVEVN